MDEASDESIISSLDLGTFCSSPVPSPPPPPLESLESRQPPGFKTGRNTFIPVQLHFAINNGDLPLVVKLIEQGTDLNYVIHCNSPLTLAIRKEQFDIARLLIQAGCDVNIPEKTKWRRLPIHLVAKIGHLDLMIKLVEHGVSVLATDITLLTPLHWACVFGHMQVAEYLVDTGANVNVRDDRGRTPLHRASENDHIELVRYLYSCGALVNIRDSHGWTPIFQNTVCGQIDMIHELLSYGADLNVQDNKGDTVLHIAAGKLRGENLNILCRTDINIYTRHLKVATPAVKAAVRSVGDNLDVVALFLDNCADVNVKNVYGESPLCIAAREGQVDVVQILVAAGSDLTAEPWIMEQDWPEKLRCHDDVCHWLHMRAERRVQSLVDICKYLVRRCLKHNISARIMLLPLPQKLKEYLFLKLYWRGR